MFLSSLLSASAFDIKNFNTLQSTNSVLIPKLLIDSHIHAWSDGTEPFLYVDKNEPPSEIKNCQYQVTMETLKASGIEKAIIIQPINHKYDHAYLDTVLQDPLCHNFYKGVFLYNPALSLSETEELLHQFKNHGNYVGLRINPVLWPNNEKICNENGKFLYSKYHELNFVVHIMCFTGLSKYYEDIIQLIQSNIQTKLVIDHWGFFVQNGVVDETSWEQLLSLAQYPNVYIKTSAFFRVSSNNEPFPYNSLDERLVTLVKIFGAHRLMFGSDYPYVLMQEPRINTYQANLECMISPTWIKSKEMLTVQDWAMIYGCTATALYGL